METRVPTSVVLESLLHDAPTDRVSLNWIVDRLQARSFGAVIFLIALVALLPGASPFMAILLPIPAIQMILARPAPVLPRILATRSISTARLAPLVKRVARVLKWMERLVRPRWRTPLEATKRVIGVLILLLGATFLVPIPFVHILPTLAIMLLAFAFLEEDGVLLCIALGAAGISLSFMVAVVWGAIDASLFL